MTELEQIEEFKKNNNKNMAKLMAVHGMLPPVCTLLVQDGDEYKVVIAPIPEEALENDKNKQKFLTSIKGEIKL